MTGACSCGLLSLRDRISAERAKLEAFGDRMTAFMTRTPQLEATMDAINTKLGVVDEGTKKATRLGEVAAELPSLPVFRQLLPYHLLPHPL